MLNCNWNGQIFNNSVLPTKWHYKDQLAYQEFWKDVLYNTTLVFPMIGLQFLENGRTGLFSLKIQKSINRRSINDENSMDMPVVFMPEKSASECVAKPKVVPFKNTVFTILHLTRIKIKT